MIDNGGILWRRARAQRAPERKRSGPVPALRPSVRYFLIRVTGFASSGGLPRLSFSLACASFTSAVTGKPSRSGLAFAYYHRPYFRAVTFQAVQYAVDRLSIQRNGAADNPR